MSKTVIKRSLTGDISDPEKIGLKLANILMEKGAKKILDEIRRENSL